jgi:hypothetical protein
MGKDAELRIILPFCSLPGHFSAAPRCRNRYFAATVGWAFRLVDFPL